MNEDAMKLFPCYQLQNKKWEDMVGFARTDGGDNIFNLQIPFYSDYLSSIVYFVSQLLFEHFAYEFAMMR